MLLKSREAARLNWVLYSKTKVAQGRLNVCFVQRFGAELHTGRRGRQVVQGTVGRPTYIRYTHPGPAQRPHPCSLGPAPAPWAVADNAITTRRRKSHTEFTSRGNELVCKGAWATPSRSSWDRISVCTPRSISGGGGGLVNPLQSCKLKNACRISGGGSTGSPLSLPRPLKIITGR